MYIAYLSTQPIFIACNDFQYYAKSVSVQLDIFLNDPVTRL
jgi:hypothetical protein